MAEKSPYHRADGSLKLSAQVKECFARNSNDLHGMFKGSGYGVGDCLRANGAALRDMFSR